MLGRVWPEGACRPSPAFPSCRHVRRHRSGCRRDPAVYEQHGEFSGGLLLQALAIGAFLPARSLGEFYAVASVFGLAYGGVMPLYAVLARDYFGPRIMGTVFGACVHGFLPWHGGGAGGRRLGLRPLRRLLRGCTSVPWRSGLGRWQSPSPFRRCPGCGLSASSRRSTSAGPIL